MRIINPREIVDVFWGNIYLVSLVNKINFTPETGKNRQGKWTEQKGASKIKKFQKLEKTFAMKDAECWL